MVRLIELEEVGVMHKCQPPPAPGVPVCGSEGLHTLSYPLPARWPLDAFQLVMENYGVPYPK